MIMIFIATEILVILLLFFLFRRKDYFSIAIMENAFRVYLIFILLVLLPLLFIFTLYTGKTEGVPFYVIIINILTNVHEKERLVKILVQIFILIALLTVPIMTVIYLCFGYRQFLRFLGEQNVKVNDRVIMPMKNILKEVMRITKIKVEPALFLIEKDVENSIPGFTGCGIIGKGKNSALLVSEDFIDLTRRGVLSEAETKAIFLHELSHVLHRDHFMPLWARSFVPSPIFTIAAISCFLSLFFGILRSGLSLGNILLLIFLLFGLYLFRVIIMHVAAHAIREREYLADARTAYFYDYRTELIEAIKKISLHISPSRSMSKVWQFIDRFVTVDVDEYIEIAHNFKEAVIGVKQRFMNFFLVRVRWHAKVHKRIRAIKQNTNVIVDLGFFLSPFSIIGLCFLAVSCILLISVSASFLGISSGLRQELSILFSHIIVTILIFLSCLPVRLTPAETLKKTFIPVSWKQLPFHFFVSKFWTLMHLNNLFILAVGILCLAINNIFTDLIDGLILFFAYTMLSVLFVTLIFMKNLRKEKLQ